MAELRPYEPTWRDRIGGWLMPDGRASPEYARVVEALVGSRGLGSLGNVNLADLTPVLGLGLAANELSRARTFGEALGPALALAPAALAGGVAAYRAARPALLGEANKSMAAHHTSMYNPPAKPARAFAEDYKSVEGIADGSGKLTRTIDGAPITAKYVVGRQEVGGSDVALPSEALDEIATALTGQVPLAVASGSLPRKAIGAYRRANDGRGLQRTILFDQSLTGDDIRQVIAHEIGHGIDDAAGKAGKYDRAGPLGEIPQDGIKKDLARIYSDTNTSPSEWRMATQEKTGVPIPAKYAVNPTTFGYKGEEVAQENMAEAIRAYASDPNYIKTVAPAVADRIRKFVNTHPKLKDIVQFNSAILPTAGAGVGAVALMGSGGEGQAAERKAGLFDDLIPPHGGAAPKLAQQNGLSFDDLIPKQGPSSPPEDGGRPNPPAAHAPPTRVAREADPSQEQVQEAQLEIARGQVAREGGAVGAGMLGLARAVPFADRIGSALDYATGMGQGKGATSYAEALARNRAMIQAYDEAHPVSGLAGQVVGALALPGAGIAAQGLKGAAKLGGLYGAAYGASGADDLTNVGDVAGKAAVGGALGAAGGAALAKGGQIVADRLTPAVAPKITDALRAAQELGVPLPRFVATDSRVAQQAGEMSRNLPFVGGAITRAGEKLTGDLEAATAAAADRFGTSESKNVANRIGTTLDDVALAETQSAQRALEQRVGALASGADAAEQAALGAGNSAFGAMSAREAGGHVAGAIRASENAARAAKDHAYRKASGAADTFADSNFVSGVGQRIRGALEEQGRVVDPILTPAAARMVDEAARISQMVIPNKATTGGIAEAGADAGQIVGVSLKGLESTRRRLNAMAQAANNDADRAAARVIVREFDAHVGDAFERAMISGDDAALDALKAARAANSDWRTRFGFNGRDDADKIINKVVGGEITEQELANYLVGSTQVGARGVATRLIDRIMEATAGSEAAKGALRATVWTRLSHQIEGVTPPSPDKIASNIFEFLGGSGAQVAGKLFTPAEQAILKGYAMELRSGVAARGQAKDMLKAGVPPGPMAQLARDVLGSRGRSDESLFAGLEAMARSGSRGDIQTLARVMSAIPHAEQASLAGAMARKLGVSPRTGEFSPDVFVTQWNSYTPQAKAMLFGMTGEARAALDNIAAVASKYVDVKRTFGNPSGTAKNALGGFAIYEPLSAIKMLGGGVILANMLAKPAAVKAVSTWSRAYERLMIAGDKATPQMIKLVGDASHSAMRHLGVDPIKMIAGARASYAEHDEEMGRRH